VKAHEATKGLPVTCRRALNGLHETRVSGHGIAGCFLVTAAFAQTVQISGTVTAVTGSQIEVQSGTDIWTIKRNSTTKVTSGKLKVGSQVTVECAALDAQ
jgi:hypothetical protein